MKKTYIAIFSLLLIISCTQKNKGPVEFKIIDLKADIPLVEGAKDSIHYHIEFKFTELTDYYNGLVLEKVKQDLNKYFFNAEKLEFSSDPHDNFQKLVEAYTPAYREEGLKLKSEMDEMSYMLNYELIKSSKIIYNQNDILIIEIESYVYAGGAHGMNNIQYLHFDLKNGNEFGIDDAFISGSKEKLKEIIESKSEEMKNNNNSLLFDDAKAELNNNFYFDSKNVNFVYNPYEIGPYASGYITISVPIENLKSLIVKNGPLGFLTI